MLLMIVPDRSRPDVKELRGRWSSCRAVQNKRETKGIGPMAGDQNGSDGGGSLGRKRLRRCGVSMTNGDVGREPDYIRRGPATRLALADAEHLKRVRVPPFGPGYPLGYPGKPGGVSILYIDKPLAYAVLIRSATSHDLKHQKSAGLSGLIRHSKSPPGISIPRPKRRSPSYAVRRLSWLIRG